MGYDLTVYKVEPEKEACEKCGEGAMWNVVYVPENIALGTMYGSKDEAEEIADDLNDAWNKGYETAEKESRVQP